MKKTFAIIIISVLFVLLMTMSVAAICESARANKFQIRYENALKSSLSQSISDMRTIESDLSKLLVTTDRNSEMLASVALKSAGCGNNLSLLPIVATNAQNVLKFTNQLSSYCTTVLKEDSLPENFDQQIFEFFETSTQVNLQLSALETQILSGELDILTVGDGKTSSDGMFGSITDSIMEYPSVIFDGPFSDGQESTTPKVKREAISAETAQNIAEKLGFNVEYSGEIDGVIPAYLLKGENSSVQITKEGGLLLMAVSEREVNEKNMSVEDGQTYALEFVEKLGYGSVKNVWQENYGNTAIYNFATDFDGVICYPDIFKVKVALDNGEILSYEGKSYVINNREREKEQPKISKNECAEKLKGGFTVTSARLCVISVNNKEKLAWEFFGEYKNMKYVLYYSAQNGEELTSFRIINSDSGEMVI